MSDAPQILRTARTQAAIRELALVLAAAGIEHRVACAAGEWRLVVAAANVAAATSALEGYERERVPPARADEPAYQSWAGFHLGAALWAFYGLTGPAWLESRWSARGAADADRLLHGEPWRAVTALTLHADAAHLLGNVVACAVFVTALARIVGPGLAGVLVLVAGASGNVLAAALRGAGHTSVGASTAIFGAIGILGGLEFGRRRGRARAWLPIAGSLALLAMLGTSPRSDLLAHLFGFVAGIGLGIVTALLVAPPRPLVQVVLGGAGIVAVVGCWLLAFGLAS